MRQSIDSSRLRREFENFFRLHTNLGEEGIREHIQFSNSLYLFFFFFFLYAQGMNWRFWFGGSIIILVEKRNYTKDFIFIILLRIQTTEYQ